MQLSTNLSSTVYTTGMLLTLALVNGLEVPNIKLDQVFSAETIKYLSSVDEKVVYMNKVKSTLNKLKDNLLIDSFDILPVYNSNVTTFLINIPKSKNIKKLVDTNMAISEAFANIPEDRRDLFTTIQQMV